VRVGIVGYGVVGRALKQVFEEKNNDEVWFNDLIYASSKKEHLVKYCKIIFICVQTPTEKDGTQNLEFIEMVLEEFRKILLELESERNPLFVIKSTVLPETTNALRIKYPHLRIAVNPEFLREKTAIADARNPDRIIVGTPVTGDGQLLLEFYKDWHCPKFWFRDPTEAELVKYLSNAFLIHKVAFSCEADRICNSFGCNSADVMNAVVADKRISRSHLRLKGAIPVDSPCLPKDLKALRKLLKTRGVDSELLNVIWKIGVQKK